ncbi:hypothetical protein MP228_002908 [Amoeboaphelidium protococcarum]|nr:hypothetical protein MP228_002908 [Amoeboaphelidium protococcarum]
MADRSDIIASGDPVQVEQKRVSQEEVQQPATLQSSILKQDTAAHSDPNVYPQMMSNGVSQLTIGRNKPIIQPNIGSGQSQQQQYSAPVINSSQPQQQQLLQHQSQQSQPTTAISSQTSQQKQSSAQQSAASGGVMQVQVSLPDGVNFKSVLNFGEIALISDLIVAICAKTGLKPSSDYDLVEIKSDSSEKIIKSEDNAFKTVMKIKEQTRSLGVRKKKPQVGQRKMNFVSSTRNAFGKSMTVGQGMGNLLVGSNQSGLEKLDQAAAVVDDKPATDQGKANVNAPKRRLSLSENFMNWAGFKSSGSSGKDQEQKKVDVLQVLSTPSTYDNSSHITRLSQLERRDVMQNVIQYLPQLFEGCDHNLQFSKLAERQRFLTRAKSNASMMMDLASSRSSNQTQTAVTSSAKVSQEPQRVFGVPLRQVMENERERDPTCKVPSFLKQSIDYLLDRALHVEGIFRISGVSRKVKALKDDVDAGRELNLSTVDDLKPHDVTGMLKQFLREMPDPLLTYKLYDYYVQAAKLLDGEKLLSALKLITFCLPNSNIHVLEALLKLLYKVADNADVNQELAQLSKSSAANIKSHSSLIATKASKDDVSAQIAVPNDESITSSTGGNHMNANNLSIVIAPNILRNKDEKAENLLYANDSVTKVVECMIMNVDTLFLVPYLFFVSLDSSTNATASTTSEASTGGTSGLQSGDQVAASLSGNGRDKSELSSR